MKSNKCIICNQEKNLDEAKTRPGYQQFCESCWRNNDNDTLFQYQMNYSEEENRMKKFTTSSGVDYEGWIKEIEEELTKIAGTRKFLESKGMEKSKCEKIDAEKEWWLKQQLIRLREEQTQIQIPPKK